MWSRSVGQQQQFILRVLADIALPAFCHLEKETLDIWRSALVGIPHHGTPHLMRNEFLYPHDVVLVVVVGIEIGHIVFSALEHHEDMLALVELAEQSALVVVV